MSAKKSSKVDPKHPFAALETMKRALEEQEIAKTQAAKDAEAKGRAAWQAKSPTQAKAQATASAKDAAARLPDSWRWSSREGFGAGSSVDDEALSFHRLMSGVMPIEATKHGKAAVRIPKSQAAVGTSAAAEEARKRRAEGLSAEEREAEAVRDHLRQLVEGNTRFEVSDDGRRTEGRRIDLPPDALRKLRRGVMPIDGQIDLHGAPAEEARTRLELFLRDKRAHGERCVLVVHGKGEHSPGGVGVLRGEMSAWLSQGKASEHVAAFASAHVEDGGAGAVYVLLRR